MPGTGLAGVETPATGTDMSEAPTTIIGKGLAAAATAPRRVLTGSRRNLVAAGAGALLAAVLGTVVTLGTTASGGDQNTPMNVKPVETAQEDNADDGLPAEDIPSPGSSQRPRPSASGSDTATTPAAGTGGAGSVSGGGSGGTDGGGSSTGGGAAGGGSGGGSHGGGTGGNQTGGGNTGGSHSGGSGDPTDGGSTDGGSTGSPSTSPSDSGTPTPTPTETGTDGGADDGGTTASASAPDGSATGTDLPGVPDTSGTIA
ncbi:hypothetical protein ACFZAU_27660 [Streptomyces sp. NPDC008238]